MNSVLGLQGHGRGVKAVGVVHRGLAQGPLAAKRAEAETLQCVGFAVPTVGRTVECW
jgi:hypothetical protein